MSAPPITAPSSVVHRLWPDLVAVRDEIAAADLSRPLREVAVRRAWLLTADLAAAGVIPQALVVTVGDPPPVVARLVAAACGLAAQAAAGPDVPSVRAAPGRCA